jgi:CubicO group peptidase (beta-lactamase class C family)/predicted Ser/Thr protein kinase
VTCPDEALLTALARGTLSEERAAALRDHIGDCADCRSAVASVACETEDEGGPRYKLERLVATGGMGEVFLAHDKVLGRDVALKLLREDASGFDAGRLAREARALAKLAHPNVVAVHDQGILDGRPFLAMEFVRGRTLRQWLAEERPPPKRIVAMLVQAGRGLAAAHEVGVVHRDFKPENVLVGDDGRARVTDFGLATRPDAPSAPSLEAASGTPGYIAPEQLAGTADARSDQYAFAVTLYEALHGERPRAGAKPRGPLARALDPDPARRYPRLRDLLDDLERRPRARRAAIVAALLAIAALGAFIFVRRGADLHAPCTSGACRAPLVCRYAEGNLCGAAGDPGACGWPVDGCDANAREVCGCDGTTYRNECDAHQRGVSTAYRGACVACSGPCADVTANGKRTGAFCKAGLCAPRPSACARGGEHVCGRDGAVYENACEARRAGTDVAPGASCAPIEPSAAPATFAEGLAFGAPDEQGVDARPLVQLSEWIAREKLPIFSLLVSRNGVVVYELYTASLTRDHAHYLMGVTATVTAAVVGAAIDRAIFPSIDVSVADAFPREAFPTDADRERVRPVRLRDVLLMSALDAPVPPHDNSPEAAARLHAFLASPNRASFALGQPVLAQPGVSYEYTDITPVLATGAITYATHATALELAEKALFKPMDFHDYEWMHQDKVGIDNGAWGLRLRPIDMQKFGILHLREGRWEGRQLLSAEWVRLMTTPQIRAGAAAEPNCAFFWRTIDLGPRWSGRVTSGWKGQRIAIFPDPKVVVTMTGALEPPENDGALFARIVREHVAPAVDRTRGRPDAALRDALAAAIAAAGRVALPPNLEGRMVPSVAPKERHHDFALH